MKVNKCLLFILLFTQINVSAQKLISVEVPVAVSINRIVIPTELQPYIEAKSNTGYMLGLGVKVKLKRNFAVRTGMQIWNKPLQANYPSFLSDINGNLTDVLIDEKGTLRYTGFYLQFLYDSRHFFAGAGIDISVYNSYLGNIKIADASNGVVLIRENDSPRSGLTEKFLQQADLQIIVGGKLWAKDKVAFKPFASLGVAMSPLFHSGAKNQAGKEFNLSSAYLRFGMIFEFALKGEVQPSKKKNEKSTIDLKKNKNMYELER